jgi:hypothetical protein
MAGPLAEIYSASDSFKRKLVDTLRNPRAKLEQIVGDANDRAGNLMNMTYAAAGEGPGRGPATDRLARAMAESYNPMGMTKIVGPQSEALEAARKNAVKMLGLPKNNTAMDRAKALEYAEDRLGSYRSQHTAPMSADDVGAPAHQLERVYPEDIYSSQGARYYGDGADEIRDASLVRRLQAVRNKPDEGMWAHRAVPKDAPNNLQHGDWVTPDKQYAIDHGESVLNGDYKIVSRRVPAKTLFTDANSIYEFGYDRTQRFADGPASIPIMRSANPANLERSRFAAFDPARVNENDLLAGMAVGGSLAVSDDSKQKLQEMVDSLRKKK